MTNQIYFEFDRLTGRCRGCLIDSIARLPPDIHATMLGLDEKHRLMNRPKGARLLIPEREALLFVAKFYPANPLPPLNASDGAA